MEKQFATGYTAIMTETKLSFIARIINAHCKPQKQMELIIESAICHGKNFAMALSILRSVRQNDRSQIVSANTALIPFGIILSQFSDYIVATDDKGSSSTGFIV